MERVQAYVAETIRVSTRFHVHDFSMFRNVDETYLMLEQLANFAAKKFVGNFVKVWIVFRFHFRLLSESGAFHEEEFFPAVTK